jgi:hypothetical protein
VISDNPEQTLELLSRRNIFRIGSTVAAAGIAGVAAQAQERTNTRKAERDRSVSDPGPENAILR